jgi:hypothetical protein
VRTKPRRATADGSWLIADRTIATSAGPTRSSSQTSSSRGGRGREVLDVALVEQSFHQRGQAHRHLQRGGEEALPST